MNPWDQLAEDRIRKAIENGAFDDLPGMGRPLSLNENPHADPEWRLALKLLKDSGFTLPWIETRREIESGIETARADLARAHKWHRQQVKEGIHDPAAERAWQRAGRAFRERVEEINRRIIDFNLQAPAASFQMATLEPDRELEALEAAG